MAIYQIDTPHGTLEIEHEGDVASLAPAVHDWVQGKTNLKLADEFISSPSEPATSMPELITRAESAAAPNQEGVGLESRPLQFTAPKTALGELSHGNIPGAVGIGMEKLGRVLGTTEAQRMEQAIPWGTNPDGSVKYEYKPMADSVTQKGIFAPPPVFDLAPMPPDPTDPAWKAALKAGTNQVAGLAKFAMSPGGIALSLLGGAGSVATRAGGMAPAALGSEGAAAIKLASDIANVGRVTSAGFAVDMASSAPSQFKQAMDAPTLQGKIEGWIGGLASLGFAALAAKHATRESLSSSETKSLDESVKFVKENISTAPTEALQPFINNQKMREGLSPEVRDTIIAELQRRAIAKQQESSTLAAEQQARNLAESHSPATAAAVIEINQNENITQSSSSPSSNAETNDQPAVQTSVSERISNSNAGAGDNQQSAGALPTAGLPAGVDVAKTSSPVPEPSPTPEQQPSVAGAVSPDPTRTEPSPVATPAAAVPKLRAGQQQGDLLGGSEDLTLVGERVKSEAPKPKASEPTIQQTITEAIDAYGDAASAWEHLDNQVKELEGDKKNRATVARLEAAKRKIANTLEEEHRRTEQQSFDDAMGERHHELIQSIKDMGGLPTLREMGQYATGELGRIIESSKGAFLGLFRKGAPSLDTLRANLEDRGFKFETPYDMIQAIDDSIRSGKKQYGMVIPEDYRGGPGAMGPVEAAQMAAERKIFQSAHEPIQQRRIAEQRGDREEWLRRSDPDRMAEAEAIMEKDAKAGQKLVDSINAGETKVTTDVQELILVRELIEQHAARDMAAERLADSDPSITPTERAQYQRDWEAANERIGKTEDASDKTGSEKGAAFRMRRMMVADDYSLQGLSRRERKRLGRDLTKEEVDALQKESEAIKKAQSEVDAAVEAEQKANEESAVDAVLSAAIADREAQQQAAQPYHPSILARAEEIVKGIEAKRDELRAKVDWRKLFGSQSGGVGGVGGGKGEGKKIGGKSKAQETREARASAVEYLAYEIAARISRFGVDRAKTLDAMLVQFDDSIRPFFGAAWEKANKIVGGKTKSEKPKVKEAVKTGATAPEKQPKPPKSKDTLVGEGRAAVEKGEGLHNVVAQIVDGMIDAGNRDRADIFKRTTKIVQEFMPEATERDVNRAYVDYGKKTYPNPDEAAAFKRKTRQAVKIEEDIARLEKDKLRPELQGYQREKMDLELRDLVKQRSELLKDPSLPQEPGAFASKDEAKQTRIKNRIEELDRYLKTGEKPVDSKPTQPDSAITEQLRAEKEALEAYVKEVDAAKNPPLSDAQKALDAAMIARERAGQVLDDISTGKLKDPVNVREALTQLEEDVRLETDALKALAAEMRRDAKPKGDPGYLKEQAQIKALERAIANYAEKTAKGDLAGKGKIMGPDSRRVTQLKEIRASRAAAYKAARDAGKPVRSPEDRYNDTRIKAIVRREAELAERMRTGNFAPKTKPVPPKLRADVVATQAKLAETKLKYDRARESERLRTRTRTEKFLDGIHKWNRAFILSGVHTLAKLTSAAGEIVAIAPVEEAVGGVIGKIPGMSKIAEKAPRHGGFSIRAEKEAVVGMWRNLFKDAASNFKSGHTDLDLLYGKPHITPPELKDYVGRIHAVLKSPAKRNEFMRSFEKRTTYAQRNGMDIRDPMVQLKIGTEAYKDAQRSIFSEDNMVVDIWKRGMSALAQKDKVTGRQSLRGKIGETAMKTLLPIVRIPTNIVNRTFEYSLGTVSGAARIARALTNGIENLHPEEADAIMRNLKRGSVGAALMLYGYFNPKSAGGYYQEGEKRKPGDLQAGELKIGDVTISKYLVHNPLLAQIQIGSTIRRVADSRLHKKDSENQGLMAGIGSAVVGDAEEVPFVNEMFKLGQLRSPHERGSAIGTIAKQAVPQAVQQAAAMMDKDNNGNPIKRKPKGVWQTIKTGIPGLRETVPKK